MLLRFLQSMFPRRPDISPAHQPALSWFVAPSPLFCNTVCYQTLFAINNIDVHIFSHYLSSR